MTVRNPIEWSVEQVRLAGAAVESASRDLQRTASSSPPRPIAIRRIQVADLRDVLKHGFEDFGANRTDVLFVCVIYPVLGLVLARMAFGENMLPLLFPLASGFALVGPFAAIGLYEMSRRREQGSGGGLADALGVLRSPSLGSIALLGLILVAIFALWMVVALAIFDLTLGPQPPASVSAFVHDVFATPAGMVMIVLGCGVGLAFAVVAMAISVVSFPLMLDQNVRMESAVWASVRAVAANPVPMAAWGLIVAGGLVLGSIPLFLGLIVVMPVLGHGTWHLYRKLVAR